MQIGEMSLPKLFLLFQSRRIHKAINPVLLQPQKIFIKILQPVPKTYPVYSSRLNVNKEDKMHYTHLSSDTRKKSDSTNQPSHTTWGK